MDLRSLANDISNAIINIDAGRKGFANRGKAEEGRISYEIGIDQALNTFQQAQTSVHPHIIIFVEYIFLSQELQFCEPTDKHTISSLTQAIKSFNDAFLVLDVVEDSTLYHVIDKAFPHHKKYRKSGFPKDSFHIACDAHRTRIQNILRSPGIDLIEKALLMQRFDNLTAAQSGYIKKQKKAMQKKSET